MPPPTKDSALLESRRRPEWPTSLGWGTEVSWWLLIQVSSFPLSSPPRPAQMECRLGVQVQLGSIFDAPYPVLGGADSVVPNADSSVGEKYVFSVLKLPDGGS